mmetsp:Transcript_24080/g.71960  ORF Transcript_24080/g.71960 Transcript_24080/m.71960 type:complete len:370 (+) Transcript_24080:591-1700(+)
MASPCRSAAADASSSDLLRRPSKSATRFCSCSSDCVRVALISRSLLNSRRVASREASASPARLSAFARSSVVDASFFCVSSKELWVRATSASKSFAVRLLSASASSTSRFALRSSSTSRSVAASFVDTVSISVVKRDRSADARASASSKRFLASARSSLCSFSRRFCSNTRDAAPLLRTSATAGSTNRGTAVVDSASTKRASRRGPRNFVVRSSQSGSHKPVRALSTTRPPWDSSSSASGRPAKASLSAKFLSAASQLASERASKSRRAVSQSFASCASSALRASARSEPSHDRVSKTRKAASHASRQAASALKASDNTGGSGNSPSGMARLSSKASSACCDARAFSSREAASHAPLIEGAAPLLIAST